MRTLLLITLISICLPCFSQTKTTVGQTLKTKKNPILEEQFHSWEVYKISATDFFNQVKSSPDIAEVKLELGNSHDWEFSLFPNKIISDNYFTQLATGESSSINENKAFAGYEASGGKVRLTLDKDFLYGYVEKNNERWFIEPLWYFDKNASKDLFVVYEEKNVIPKSGKTCGVTEMNSKTQELGHHPKEATPESVGECYEVEIAYASDFLMFQSYGSIAAVENHNIGVLNNVQGNYDDEFADEISFVIVTQFVSNCSTCDPWSNTTNAGDLLDSFRSWGNGGNFGVPFDLGGLWTDRDLAGSTIGVAWVGAVCTSFRYHVLQDFSNNANSLRVLTAHEMGHNFDSGHDASGSGFIMAPAVNNTTTWSPATINVINAYITQVANSGNCFSNCSAPVGPVAAFDVLENNICEGTTVQFFDESQNNPISWTWQFAGGNPTISSDQNPFVTYNNPGTYNVTLTVTNSVGSNAITESGYITVGVNGTSILLWDSFESGLGNWTVENPDNARTWEPASLNGTQIGSQGAYMDNYFYQNGVGDRDGLISAPMDFSGYSNIILDLDYAYTLYSGAPSSDDSLIIYISTDGGNNYSRVFQDADNGTGNFATSQSQNNAFFPGSPASWCYAGNYGSDCISVNLSAFAGNSNVVLKLENYCEYGNNLFLDNIKITSSCQILAPPIAAFTSTTSEGCTPFTVQYTDLSQNSPSSWSWQFPGGNPATSTDPNPIVTYNFGGTFDVTLTTTNSAGTDTYFQPSYVVVEDDPTSNFTYTVSGGTVVFTNTSTGNTTTVWDFGDGNSSVDVNPTHTYTQGGSYVVTLLAINDCGTATYSETIDIVVAPTASFSSNTTSGCEPLTIQFNDLSSGGITNWAWTFPGGNPSSSTDQNPTVTYSSPGVFSVTLIASNSAGQNTIVQTDYITVDPLPTSAFNSSVSGNAVNFSNTSSNANSYSWDFGDGNTSTQNDPSHTYINDGTYTVTLTTSNNCGSVTSTETITIVTAPTGGFSANATTGCVPFSVQFNDQSSSNVTNWNWDFAGGSPSSSTDQNPLVQYNTPGIYSVILTVTNSAGTNTVTELDYVIINDVPSANFDSAVNGLLVDFTNTSSNGNTYSWDFGDGNTSTDFSPSHTYASDGTYIVTLVATNDCGSVTITETVVVTTAPTAAFNANATTGCVPMTVQFSNQSSTNATSWNWTFPGGNPSSSTDANPTVTYNSVGTFNVILEVTNAAGTSMVEETNYIVVNDIPSVNFSSAVNGLLVDFTNTSSNANTYSWDFGDGNMSSDFSPSHTYASDGTYEVILTATNECGTVTSTETVVVTTAPTAAFNANATTGCVPMTVQFSNQSSTNATSWNWTFSGGNPSSSTDENPTVTYNTAGTFNVILEVTNAAGTSMIEESNYIVVDDVPSASFTTDVNIYSVDFTNTTVNATSYSWDFGDGNTSTQNDPSHTYSVDGNYTVVLTATNGCGSTMFTQNIVIANTPTAGFSASITSGCAPLSVTFEDQSSSNTTAWSWEFPGGTPATSTDQNPTIVYNNAGTFSATLIATNPQGTDEVTITDVVVVNTTPDPNFAFAVNGPMVDFTNNSNNATTYSWDFGDGNTSNQPNPNHQYSVNGTYFVVLSATNDCGTTTVTQEVSITSSVIAGFTSTIAAGCSPLEIQFNDQSVNATSWQWTFVGGEPSVSTAQNPLVTYTNPGVYSVVLESFNSTGSSVITETGYVMVETVPFLDFNTDVNGLTVDFNNMSQGGNSYSWNFGDGNTSTDFSPIHTYADIGVYEVTITATNNCGDSELTFMVDVGTVVTAGINSNITSGCAPLEVQFSDASSNNVTAWNWTFPGGTPATSTAQNPSVVYNTPGIYEVTLEASNAFNSNTVTLSNYIVIDNQPSANFSSSIDLADVTFTNNSVDAISYSWDFGDGNMSTQMSPLHTYANDGEYVVILTATNGCGSTTYEETVVIVTPVIAAFQANVTTGCAPLEVQFSDASSENATNWNWTFTGGIPSTSTEQNPTVVFAEPGTYTVELEVSNSMFSDTETITNYIVVESGPTANFTATISGQTVTVTNLSNNATTYQWQFGDGSTAVTNEPTYTYNNAGNFTITLIATNACGSDTFTLEVEATAIPTASFQANVTSGCVPLVVQFMNGSSSNTTDWAWTFENGSPSTSSLENPVITFNTPGTHEIVLVASNSAGSTSSTLEINVGAAPVVDFTTDVNTLLASFTNTTTGATDYVWDFGDGSNTSTDENPQHEYSVGGNYVVVLTASNACGSVMIAQTIEVVGPLVSAGFTTTSGTGCAPVTVEYTDMSTNNPLSWLWEFEGGTPAMSTGQNPVVTYSTPGTYEVTLISTNFAGSNTVVESIEIIVLPDPEANFDFMTDGGNVDFTNTSNNANTYEWIFGDGNMSTEQNPSNGYTVTGVYEVMLIVTNECGTDTITQEIAVTITDVEDLLSIEKFDLFPNPNNGQFQLIIEGNPFDELEINLFNILGQNILNEQHDFSTGKLNKTYQLQNLAAATYILQVRLEGKTIHKKIVIE